MASRTVLEELARRVLDLPDDFTEDDVQSEFRTKSSEWHPDVNDDDDAGEMFIAAKAARDVLLGDIDFSDATDKRNAKEKLEDFFPEDVVDEVKQESGKSVGYRSTAEQRSDPESYTNTDFAKAGPDEKREIMKDVALGVETTIIFQSVQNMYEAGYMEEDFFEDVNEYIGEASSDVIDFSDYYNATKDSLRDEVTEGFFIESAEKIQESLEMEYGEGTTIREVARIVSHFLVQGGIDLGSIGRFVGSGFTGRDDNFTRDHPLGGHGRRRRRSRDFNFSRDSDKWTRK